MKSKFTQTIKISRKKMGIINSKKHNFFKCKKHKSK